MAISDVCRLCLTSGQFEVDLYSDSDDRLESYLQRIEENLQIQVSQHDNWPSKVCVECVAIIDEFCKYKDLVRENQEKIRNSLNEFNVDLPEAIENEEEDAVSIIILDQEQITIQNDIEETRTTRSSARKRAKPMPVSESEDEDSLDASPSTIGRSLRKREIPNKKPTDDWNKWISVMKDMELFDCTTCQSDECADFKALFRHERKDHKNDSRKRSCCGRKYRSLKKILRHMKYHLEPDAFKCDDCGKCFPDDESLNTHSLRHSSLPFQCDVCERKFATHLKLEYHKRDHMGAEGKIFQCEQCPKSFTTTTKLKTHVKGVHERTFEHICAICGTICISKCNLDQHILKHSENRQKEACGICGKYVYLLKSHLRNMHGENKPETCDICGRTYPGMINLKAHVRLVHNDPRVPCKICNKMLPSKTMGQHMFTHTGERPFACFFCSYAATSLQNRIKHFHAKHPEEYKEWRAKKYKQPVKEEEEVAKE